MSSQPVCRGEDGDVCAIIGPDALGDPQPSKAGHDLLCIGKGNNMLRYHLLNHLGHLLYYLSRYQHAQAEMVCQGQRMSGHKFPCSYDNTLLHIRIPPVPCCMWVKLSADLHEGALGHMEVCVALVIILGGHDDPLPPFADHFPDPEITLQCEATFSSKSPCADLHSKHLQDNSSCCGLRSRHSHKLVL